MRIDHDATQRTEHMKQPAGQDYLRAMLGDDHKHHPALPQMFIGEPGAYCPVCQTENVNVKDFRWECQECDRKGEIRVEPNGEVKAVVL